VAQWPSDQWGVELGKRLTGTQIAPWQWGEDPDRAGPRGATLPFREAAARPWGEKLAAVTDLARRPVGHGGLFHFALREPSAFSTIAHFVKAWKRL